MDRWRADNRGRRRAVFALALLAHIALIGAMLRSRLSAEKPDEGATVEVRIVLSQPERRKDIASVASPPPAVRLRQLQTIPHASKSGQAIVATLVEPLPILQAASVPEPPASAASAPLNLTLTRDQIRALIADTHPTLAQSLARPPAPSALARIGGDDAPYEEIPLPGGVTEVHVHGGCFHLVPTARGQSDPFNHANERLTAPCY